MRSRQGWGVIGVLGGLLWFAGHALAQTAATPTVDRLAPPPTVALPTQADEGAQLYWLHCQPCHGDQGQGLTQEWRNQYPPEDRYCWNAGCHGDRPYENGFTLPTTVPPVIGPGSLTRFVSAESLFQFIRVAMPYQDAGNLTQSEYLAIMAFLARAHGVWGGRPLTPDNLVDLHFVGAPPVTATPTPPAPAPSAAPSIWPAAGLLLLLGLVLGVWMWRRHRGEV